MKKMIEKLMYPFLLLIALWAIIRGKGETGYIDFDEERPDDLERLEDSNK